MPPPCMTKLPMLIEPRRRLRLLGCQILRTKFDREQAPAEVEAESQGIEVVWIDPTGREATAATIVDPVSA